jgi:hypothetical protein
VPVNVNAPPADQAEVPAAQISSGRQRRASPPLEAAERYNASASSFLAAERCGITEGAKQILEEAKNED